jgi:hypothetical protein
MNDFEKIYTQWKAARRISLNALLIIFLFMFISGLFGGLFHINIQSKLFTTWVAVVCDYIITPIITISYGYAVFLMVVAIKAIKNAPQLTDAMCEFQHKLNGEWLIIPFIISNLFTTDSIKENYTILGWNGWYIGLIAIGFYPAILGFYNSLIRMPKDEVGEIVFHRTGFFAAFIMIVLLGVALIIASYGPDFAKDFILSLDKNPVISVLKLVVWMMGGAFLIGEQFARRSVYGWEYPS